MSRVHFYYFLLLTRYKFNHTKDNMITGGLCKEEKKKREKKEKIAKETEKAGRKYFEK